VSDVYVADLAGNSSDLSGPALATAGLNKTFTNG
jgi:hypothetical protein